MLGEVAITNGAKAFRLGSRSDTGEVTMETIIVNDNVVTYIVDKQIPFKSEVTRTSINLIDFDREFIKNLPSIKLLQDLNAEVEQYYSLTGGVIYYMIKSHENKNWIYVKCPLTISRKSLEPFEKVHDLFRTARKSKARIVQ